MSLQNVKILDLKQNNLLREGVNKSTFYKHVRKGLGGQPQSLNLKAK